MGALIRQTTTTHSTPSVLKTFLSFHHFTLFSLRVRLTASKSSNEPALVTFFLLDHYPLPLEEPSSIS